MTHNASLHSDERFARGIRHHEAGELAEAAALYAELLKQYPNEISLLQRNVDVLMQLGRNEAVIPSLERLLELQPANTEAHYLLGMALFNTGRQAAAEARMRRALEYNPDFFAAHAVLSHIALPGEHYYHVLEQAHELLRPATYVEIGVASGASMKLARPPTLCVGIDPEPGIQFQFGTTVRIFAMTSDDFFATRDLRQELEGRPVDMAFIDGLHLFEAALRDFINIERHATGDTVVFMHDCIPLDGPTSSRQRQTTFWSGDTWKIIPCLKRYRPDLGILTLAAPPTGLAVVWGLDPGSTVLGDNMQAILEEFVPLDYGWLGDAKHDMLNVTFDPWPQVLASIRRGTARGGSAVPSGTS